MKPHQLSDLEKLEQATAAAREATREAREAQKDLRGCMREFEELISKKASDLINSETRLGMEMMVKEINKNTDSAVKHTINRFDTCTKLLDNILSAVIDSNAIESLISLMQLTKVPMNASEAHVLIRTMRSAGEMARNRLDQSETRMTLNEVPIATRFPGL